METNLAQHAQLRTHGLTGAGGRTQEHVLRRFEGARVDFRLHAVELRDLGYKDVETIT